MLRDLDPDIRPRKRPHLSDCETDNMAHIETERRLTNIALAIGKRYGYKEVHVSIHRYKDPMKLNWSRSRAIISFSVSEAFVGIPGDVAKELFTKVFTEIDGKRYPYDSYSVRTKRWIANAKKKAAEKDPAPFGL